MASDLRVHAPCWSNFYSNMKTHWADSWPVITQLFDLDLLVKMILTS